jgi:hypothetical protein
VRRITKSSDDIYYILVLSMRSIGSKDCKCVWMVGLSIASSSVMRVPVLSEQRMVTPVNSSMVVIRVTIALSLVCCRTPTVRVMDKMVGMEIAPVRMRRGGVLGVEPLGQEWWECGWGCHACGGPQDERWASPFE